MSATSYHQILVASRSRSMYSWARAGNVSLLAVRLDGIRGELVADR
ncbi:hypothetical protein AB0E75_11370 [Streptomyces griseoviridis]|nr:hypothetical protein [Streptomyces niveoruber]